MGHAAAPQAELSTRPHIVIILTDQERTPQHWPTDWADANLPNRKRLMDTGISFLHAFCNTIYFDPNGRQPNQYELYDLVNDPLETNNLAQSSDPAIHKLRSELDQRLVAQMATAQTLPFALALPLITQ